MGTMTGHKNNNYRGRTGESICEICGSCFIKNPKYKYHTRKTCSKECLSKSISSVHKGKKISRDVIDRQKHTHRVTLLSKGFVPNDISIKCGCGGKKDPKAKTCQNCFAEKKKHKRECVICGKHLYKKGIYTRTCSVDCSKIHRINISRGSGNPRWKGGVKPIHQRIRSTNKYIDWRKSVYARDKFTCQDCGQVGGQLHAHHIKEFATHPSLRLDINNGKTLCIKCHSKYHPWINTKQPRIKTTYA